MREPTMTAKITLTKQAAARRLVQSAVEMLVAEEDHLAIHVVASSSLNLLRELVKSRGDSYATRFFAESMYHDAMSLIEGKDRSLPADPDLDQMIEQIRQGIVDGSIRSFDDIDVHVPTRMEHKLLHHISAPFNFLKHADRDPNGFIDESDVKPIEAIAHAITAYSMLFPSDPVSPEVGAFVKVYIDAEPTIFEDVDGPPTPLKPLPKP